MTDPGPYVLLWRLAVAAAVAIAPTLCFLGLVRGLERLRDDDLVNEWARASGARVDDLADDDVLTVLAGGMGIEGADSSPVRCPACGTANRADAVYCYDCRSRLPS